MQYTNKLTETMKVALSLMIYHTCGEDEDTMANTEVTTIGPNIFHITSALDDPFNAMDFQVAVDVVRDSLGATDKFHYTIFRSVYGDDGDFDISIS